MSLFGDTSDNYKLVTCPYNPTHQVTKERFLLHLCRCRQNYPYKNKVNCPYNSSHVVNKPELNYHILNCESRLKLEDYQHQLRLEASLNNNNIPSKLDPIECSENWDDDDSESCKPTVFTRKPPASKRTIHWEKKQPRTPQPNTLGVYLTDAIKKDQKKRGQKK